MKTIFTLLASFFFFNAYCADFHVAKNGDDDNNGSQSDPWESIQYAMEVASPGSTVYVHEGFYNEPLYLEVSGTVGNEIVFKNFQNEEVVIDAEGFSSSSIIEIYHKSYVRIEGFTFQNHQKTDAIGILIEGRCKGISIVNCTVRNIAFSKDPLATVSDKTNSQPLIVYGTEANHPIQDLLIKGNKIYDCRTGFSEALAINGNVTDFTVEANEVYNISNIGIDIIGHEGTCNDPSKDQARNGIIKGNRTYNCLSPYATSAGIYVDGGASLIIEGNEVFGNQWGIEIGCENVGKSASDIIVRNNLVYENQSPGLHVGGYDFPNGSGRVKNCQILNNTFYNNDLENDGSGEIYLSYYEGLLFANNVVAANNTDGTILATEDLSVKSSGLEISSNDWYSFKDNYSKYFYFEGVGYNNIGEIQSSESAFTNNMSVDPLFHSQQDFRLKEDSKLIDMGVLQNSIDYGSEDFEGEDRIMGNAIDLGAYEFGVRTSAVEKIQGMVDLLIYPNPAIDFICIQSETENISSIEISDILGRRVLSSKIDDSKIDLQSLKGGQYFVNVFDGKKLLASKKLLIR